MSKNNTKIIDVYHSNFNEELRKISKLIDRYNYISVDTEFPGFVYQATSNTQEGYYKTIKMNVDSLKLIQVGLTLCDKEGNHPQPFHTWQFNIDFDLTKDKYSYESIALLTHSGIEFDKFRTHGIPIEIFSEYLFSSGLVLNDQIHWITFHGSYDFAYLLKYVSGLPLPDFESQFLTSLELYFCNFYDVRFLINNQESLKGSLSKLASSLNIKRIGTTHQAGSDALVTCEAFFHLLNYNYVSEEELSFSKNILFSIGEGNEEYTTTGNFQNFQNFTNLPNFNSNNVNYNNFNGPNKFAANNLTSQKNYPSQKMPLSNLNSNLKPNHLSQNVPNYNNFSYQNGNSQNLIYNSYMNQIPNYSLMNGIPAVQNGNPYNNYNVSSMNNMQGQNVYLKNQMNLNMGLVNSSKIPNLVVEEKSNNLLKDKKAYNNILESQSN